jgi:phosphatidylserine/phosphatidylglycerophosphate/cardiolipin synthase-like enzyme
VTDERVVRTSGQTGVKIDAILATALLAELMTPSPHLWLVSPWIGDVDAIDNRSAAYDAVFSDPSNRIYTLAEVLGRITQAGSRLSVVTRPDRFNNSFLSRLERQARTGAVHVVKEADVHEKTFCGENWLITGSMNFTFRGMTVNDEVSSYRVDQQMAATARLEFQGRFGAGNGAAW